MDLPVLALSRQNTGFAPALSACREGHQFRDVAKAIEEAGATSLLVDLLERGSADAKTRAARALTAMRVVLDESRAAKVAETLVGVANAGIPFEDSARAASVLAPRDSPYRDSDGTMATTALAAILEHGSENAQIAAAETLDELAHDGLDIAIAVPALMALIETRSAAKNAALQALAGDRELWLHVLYNRSTPSKTTAYRAAIVSHGGIDALVGFVCDGSDRRHMSCWGSTPYTAIRLLGALARDDDAKAAIEAALVATLENGSDGSKLEVARSLHFIECDIDGEVYRELLHIFRDEAEERAAPLRAALAALLTNENEAITRAATQALVMLGILESSTEILRRGDDGSKERAVRTLYEIVSNLDEYDYSEWLEFRYWYYENYVSKPLDDAIPLLVVIVKTGSLRAGADAARALLRIEHHDRYKLGDVSEVWRDHYHSIFSSLFELLLRGIGDLDVLGSSDSDSDIGIGIEGSDNELASKIGSHLLEEMDPDLEETDRRLLAIATARGFDAIVRLPRVLSSLEYRGVAQYKATRMVVEMVVQSNKKLPLVLEDSIVSYLQDDDGSKESRRLDSDYESVYYDSDSDGPPPTPMWPRHDR